MTPEEQALLAVVRLLETLGVPYMVVGSVASSHHGRPRATHDADIVIEPTSESLDALVRCLADSGFYVDGARAREALASRRQFNVIDIESATKVDLIVRKDRPFSREEFRRRYETEISEGVRIALSTPEDSILSKLEWAKKSGESEKQLYDVAGIVDVRPDLDRAYIVHWAEELDVLDLWTRVVAGRC
jgi:Mg-chelatase subunit ChlI